MKQWIHFWLVLILHTHMHTNTHIWIKSGDLICTVVTFLHYSQNLNNIYMIANIWSWFKWTSKSIRQPDVLNSLWRAMYRCELLQKHIGLFLPNSVNTPILWSTDSKFKVLYLITNLGLYVFAWSWTLGLSMTQGREREAYMLHHPRKLRRKGALCGKGLRAQKDSTLLGGNSLFRSKV